MKKFFRITAAFLCVLMILPMITYGYSNGTVENPTVQMPKESPVIDGDIETYGNWSSAAYLNDATMGHFWGGNPLTSSAQIYFAYDTTGLYFAADITDNNEMNGFVASTGYDNINNSGSSHPYGFNGDVMTLMLDPLGLFQKSQYYQTTPWYNIGMYADGTVGVYRSKADEGDISSLVSAAGKITETGWRFEVCIPWSVIAEDVAYITDEDFSVTAAQLYASGATSRAACMYMDRYYTSGTAADTWGRFISVCTKTYDGYSGVVTSGVYAKSYGITLYNATLHTHTWGEWVVDPAPTCTQPGSRTRTCTTCKVSVTEEVSATGHVDTYTETTDPTCTADGSTRVICRTCGTTLSETALPATGHAFGDWLVVTAPTATAFGTERRTCATCGFYEERILPALNAPELSVYNYNVYISNVSEINYIRFASGVLTTSTEIRNAPDYVGISARLAAENTENNVFSWKMPNGGVYTFWVRLNDGSTYFMTADLSIMDQEVTADGVRLTVHNLYGVRDVFIAKGDYDTYRDVSDNRIIRMNAETFGDAHDYSYSVPSSGLHTLCVRYNDPSRPYTFLKIDIDQTEPTFEPDGLQLHIGNLQDVKVVRSAYGELSTSHDIKAADGCRNFTYRTLAKYNGSYTIQYRENGIASVCVEYMNGYQKVYQFEVEKKVPTYVNRGNTVLFGNLDGLYIIRYAPGEFDSSSAIKNTPGARVVRPSAASDGVITVSGLADSVTYTFCVQYSDESYNFFTMTAYDTPPIDPAQVIDVSNQRQLLLEDYAIDTEYTDASFVLNTPQKKNVVFDFNQGYESRDTVYHNITTLPGGGYRMYYKATDSSGKRRICYIQSSDGLNWTRPLNTNNLYNGSASNITTADTLSPDNLFVFYDTNPACEANKRWKGIYGQWGDGLFIEYSTDGKNFAFWPNESTMMTTPTATNGCFFDTLNTVYWDSAKGKYVAFVRGFHEGSNYNLTKEYVQSNGSKICRDIRYSESTDCINWTIPVPLVYNSTNDYQMYANAIAPYFRAPQLYIGLPTRYQLPAGSSSPLTDIFLMSSRDLLNWDRTSEAYLTPNGPGTTYDYTSSGYPCVGFIPTSATEMSTFMKEEVSGNDRTVLYRYSMRTDGFRAAHGDAAGKQLVTKYMNYTGTSLELNYAAAAGGKLRVTMADAQGNKVSSGWMTGDQIAATVSFNAPITGFAGKPVTLTFELFDADLYSFKFN